MGSLELPTEFDAVILGTGFCESILSAAISRSGRTVLHLDAKDFYGGKWTSVSFDQLESGAFCDDPNTTTETGSLSYTDSIREVVHEWYSIDEDVKNSVRNLKRKFNVDMLPKAILAKDNIIELLIQSDVSRYLEFKCVNKLLVSLEPPEERVIQPIPFSRSDIFVSSSLSLVEKRKLAKFIELMLQNAPPPSPEADSETGEEPPQKDFVPRSFSELVKAASLSAKLEHLIRSAIMSIDQDSASNEIEAQCQVFLKSIGRYGNQTPFLWTLYGVGEICQAFCRMSAIFGGIFILKKCIQDLNESEDHVLVKLDDKLIKTKHVFMGSDYNYGELMNTTSRTVARGILVIRDGYMYSEEEKDENHIWVYKFGNAEVLELNHTSSAVPQPFRLIQVTCPYTSGTTSPKDTVHSVMSKYLHLGKSCCDFGAKVEEGQGDTETCKKPEVLYGCYFLVDTKKACNDDRSRIKSCASGSSSLSSEIARAKELFAKLYPDDEFLPKPEPPPEEVEITE